MDAERERGGSGTAVGVLAAFGAIYLIWGSTYLAVRFAVEAIPPFGMMGVRSLFAGVVLFAWGSRRASGWPSGREWGRAALIGAFLFLIGHGGLAWAEQRVASGIASLIESTIPLWMVLIQARTEGAGSIGWRTFMGVVGGSAGVLLLVGPGGHLGGESVNAAGAVVLLVAALSWSVGSGLAQRERSTRPVSMTTGMYLIGGGVLLLVLSVLAGEPAALMASVIPARSVLALTYLIVFGSVIAFGAYAWLLKHASLSAISTHAWVNPVVALFLGWVIAGEALNARVSVAASLVVASVVLTLSSRGRNDDRKNLAWQDTPGRRRNIRAVRSGDGRGGAAAHTGQPCFDGAHRTG